MNERQARVLSMRSEGKSFREIATDLGISTARVSQIYVRAIQLQQSAEVAGYVGDDEPLRKLGLNIRSCNALGRMGIETVGQVLELVRSERVLHIRNFGPTAYEELREKLKVHGRLTE
jgi:DNA-directed RNA polymerase alpha subunit